MTKGPFPSQLPLPGSPPILLCGFSAWNQLTGKRGGERKEMGGKGVWGEQKKKKKQNERPPNYPLGSGTSEGMQVSRVNSQAS